MDVNKNSYTFLFAFVLVVVVAALLSFAATALKPAQQENIRLEKMQSILSSINEKVDRNAAGEVYAQFIVEEVVVRNGKPVSGVKAFDIHLATE
jgi:Na+-transporting NADH:ubiquinone oxidoreductase, subunit NqrC